jgi:hypothetical protein
VKPSSDSPSTIDRARLASSSTSKIRCSTIPSQVAVAERYRHGQNTDSSDYNKAGQSAGAESVNRASPTVTSLTTCLRRTAIVY